MDCLHLFALSTLSESGFLLYLVLSGSFSPFIYSSYDFVERFLSLGSRVLDMKRESRKGFCYH